MFCEPPFFVILSLSFFFLSLRLQDYFQRNSVQYPSPHSKRKKPSDGSSRYIGTLNITQPGGITVRDNRTEENKLERAKTSQAGRFSRQIHKKTCTRLRAVKPRQSDDTEQEIKILPNNDRINTLIDKMFCKHYDFFVVVNYFPSS